MRFIERTEEEMLAMFAIASKLVSFARLNNRRFPTAEAEEVTEVEFSTLIPHAFQRSARSSI